MIDYIKDSCHYNQILLRASNVKSSLWIGTADIKDLYAEKGKEKIPFLGVLASVLKRGVSVRLIHAKEPGPNFREDFDRYPILATQLERVLCPRVHFKMMILLRTSTADTPRPHLFRLDWMIAIPSQQPFLPHAFGRRENPRIV